MTVLASGCLKTTGGRTVLEDGDDGAGNSDKGDGCQEDVVEEWRGLDRICTLSPGSVKRSGTKAT